MRCSIAGLNVELACGGRTKAQAEAYLASACAESPQITISVDAKAALARRPELQSEDLAEYLLTGDRFALALLEHEGFMLHASAVCWDGQAVCFSAPPGVGKSTHSEKWHRLFGAEILNDDKPALRRVDGRWMAYGTPWSGKHDLSRPAGAPLKVLCFLFRGEENKMEPLAPARALPLLLSQTLFQLRRERMERLLPLADDLLRHVSVWKLTCNQSDEGAELARNTIFPERERYEETDG